MSITEFIDHLLKITEKKELNENAYESVYSLLRPYIEHLFKIFELDKTLEEKQFHVKELQALTKSINKFLSRVTHNVEKQAQEVNDQVIRAFAVELTRFRNKHKEPKSGVILGLIKNRQELTFAHLGLLVEEVGRNKLSFYLPASALLTKSFEPKNEH